jgi:hypothetical protein
VGALGWRRAIGRLSRRWRLLDEEDRIGLGSHRMVCIEGPALDQAVERLHALQFVISRRHCLDASDCGFERPRQSSDLQHAHGGMLLPGLALERDACELVDGVPQLRRIVLHRPDHARKHNGEVELRRRAR